MMRPASNQNNPNVCFLAIITESDPPRYDWIYESIVGISLDRSAPHRRLNYMRPNQMKNWPRLLAGASSGALPYVTGAVVLAIFVVDTLTDLEIAFPVFYIAVMLMSVSFLEKRGVIIFSLACMGLTVLSFILTSSGAGATGLINCAICLATIATSTYLVLKIESAEVAAHDARAQLAHIGRLTALGELTASIAHEVNQPLAAIVTSGNACSRWLGSSPPNLEKARQAVERMVTDANRASAIIKRVCDLAKKAPPQKDWFDFNEAILEVLTLTRNEIELNRISLETELADDLPLVRGDRIQLQQVVLNLIINSIEALAGRREGSRRILVESKRKDSNEVLIGVCDSGSGLDPRTLDRLFDAFYTTKRDGMGMGLAIGRGIVQAHGGRISATAATPCGAKFEFTLPVGSAEGP